MKLVARQWVWADLHTPGVGEEIGILHGRRKCRSQLRDARGRQIGRRRQRPADFFRLREQLEDLPLLAVVSEIYEPWNVRQVRRLLQPLLQDDVELLSILEGNELLLEAPLVLLLGLSLPRKAGKGEKNPSRTEHWHTLVLRWQQLPPRRGLEWSRCCSSTK